MSVKNINVKKFEPKDLFVILFLLFIAVIFVGLFYYDLMQTLSLQNVDPAGTVVIKKNTVQRRFARHVLWNRLGVESPVYIGDLIRVADVSSATLYIGASSIELEENTLIRIMLAPDGESIVIQVSSGEVAIVPTEESRKIFVEVNGTQTQAQPGEALTVSVTDTGNYIETNEIAEWLENTGRMSLMTETKIQLISPAVNSLLRYQDISPVVNFQWEEAENAIFYEIEIFMTPNTDHPFIRESYLTPYMTETRLWENTWYWRVRPVYSSVYNVDTIFSDISFFRIVKDESVSEAENASEMLISEMPISDWLAFESPLMTELPPDLPPEIIPDYLAVMPPEPEITPAPTPIAVSTPSAAVTPPPPPPPAPLPRLPAPRNMLPARGTVFGSEELRNSRNIEFNWSPVPEATGYILTIYQQTTSGRREVLRTNIINRPNYTLGNLGILDRGTFVWQVEAVVTRRDNVIQRRGTPGESNFIIDFPIPGPIIIDDTGILYGN